MGPNRAMVVNGHRVVNFGSDSFLGLDQDSRVQEALLRGMRKWGTHNGASRAFASVREALAAGMLVPDLAFLAMAQYQLGQQEQAQATLARLREAVAKAPSFRAVRRVRRNRMRFSVLKVAPPSYAAKVPSCASRI